MINVCYCGNKRIFPGLLLSVMSLAEHTAEPLRVLILSMDLHGQDPAFIPFSKNQMNILNEVLRKKNAQSCAQLLDLTEQYTASLAAGKNRKAAIYTPYAMLRLFLDELPGMPDKIIYLDIDTMCVSDIAQLYDIDISACEYAAALDYMGKFWIDRHYCNSGVLLLNLQKIRERGLFRKCRELICAKKMAMPDQSALHRCATSRLELPMRFNEQRSIKPDTVIKHFNKGIKWYLFIPRVYNYKQWQRDKVQNRLKIHDFDDIYAEYDRLAEKYDLNE